MGAAGVGCDGHNVASTTIGVYSFVEPFSYNMHGNHLLLQSTDRVYSFIHYFHFK